MEAQGIALTGTPRCNLWLCPGRTGGVGQLRRQRQQQQRQQTARIALIVANGTFGLLFLPRWGERTWQNQRTLLSVHHFKALAIPGRACGTTQRRDKIRDKGLGAGVALLPSQSRRHNNRATLHKILRKSWVFGATRFYTGSRQGTALAVVRDKLRI